MQEANQIILCSFLQSQDCAHLEAHVIFSHLWAISWTKHEKGSLHIRISVLFWNWQILWRATIPGWYLWHLFNSQALRNSFLRALPPTIGQSFFWAGSSPADIDGPILAAISVNCLVKDNSGDLPTYSSFFTSSLNSILPGIGGPLQL